MTERRQPDDPGPDGDPDDDRHANFLRDFRRATNWGIFWAVVVMAVGIAMMSFGKETQAGLERPPCESETPMCCWAPGSLPICQLED